MKDDMSFCYTLTRKYCHHTEVAVIVVGIIALLRTIC